MKDNFIKYYKQNKLQLAKLVFVMLAAAFMYFVGWNRLDQTPFSKKIGAEYEMFSAKIAVSLAHSFNFDINYSVENKTLDWNSTTQKLIMPEGTFNLLFSALLLLFLVSIKYWKNSISAFLFVFLFIAMLAGVISYTMLVYRSQIQTVLLVWINPLIYLLLNEFRLSVLLLYINNTYNQIGLNKIELHNNATYFMYLVAFGGFMGYWVGINRTRL